jgi:catechol-2,3-dioxygenase
MSATPKFAHVVFQTSQPKQMSDWYCTVLDGHVVYEDDGLAFITFDEEHHRVALLKVPVPLERKTPATAAMHHVAYTFGTIDDLLDRYVLLRDQGIGPAVCIAHGVTTSMYYRDPDGNMVEMQIDRFADPDDATRYMRGPEYAARSPPRRGHRGGAVRPGLGAEGRPARPDASAHRRQLVSRSWPGPRSCRRVS